MIKLKKTQLLRLNKDKIKDKKVILRVDFNLEEINGNFYGKYRIEAIKETVNFLKEAKKIILISHFDDPERKEGKYSLKRILPLIQKVLKIKIGFLEDLNQISQEKFSLLENIRFWPEEKKNDLDFAKKLSSLGEVFVNDAFSVSHRKHASIYLLPKLLPTYFGFNFEREITLLNKVLKSKNSAFILGGAKISTKLPLIKKFLKKANLIFLAGGLANTYLKSLGFEVGKSLIEEEMIEEIKRIRSGKILIPFSFKVKNKNNRVEIKNLGEIGKEDEIIDVFNLENIFKELRKAKIIIWNGPLGIIEKKESEKGTLNLAKFLASLKNKFILVGGGDTLGFLERKKLLKKFKFISTGGGAMLEYLATEKLPIFEK